MSHAWLGLAAWLALGATSAGSAATSPPADVYTLHDFYRVEKIDAHMHVHGGAQRLMDQVIADRFRILTINVDYPDFPPIDAQLRDASALRQRFPDRVAFAGTFSVKDFALPDWTSRALAQIEDARSRGAVGIKVWKNIGMVLEDPDGHYVMLDDSRFGPLLQRIEQDHLVLLVHQAEPLNCWLPPARMTVRGDRDYFEKHPQYYMFRHPEMPSHDSILAARDRALMAHPRLRVDAVHLASLEWDVDRVAGFLDEFPQAQVDMAARLVHLEFQAAKDRQKVRAFLIKYQDRILYGTDAAYGPDDADPQAVSEIHRQWLEDWRFLATDEPMRSTEFEPAFRGLGLPRSVLDKIYSTNAETLFEGAWASK